MRRDRCHEAMNGFRPTGKWPRQAGGINDRQIGPPLLQVMALVILLQSPLFQTVAAELALSQGVKSGSSATFIPVRIGAGGFITNISISKDGTKVVRTDTFGAWACYRCSNTTGRWSQLVNHSSLPAAEVAAEFGKNPSATGCCGVYEIVVAPSNSAVAYMYYDGLVFVTTNLDACATPGCPDLKWRRTAFSQVAANPNDDNSKVFGPKIAVDPANPDIAFVGTPGKGLFKTINGTAGSSALWSHVDAVDAGSPVGNRQGGGNLVCFDPASAVRDGATQGVFVSTYGSGVYHSVDGGSTWIKTDNSPTTHVHIFCDQNGDLWLTDNLRIGQNLNKYSRGSWSNITTALGNGMRNVSIAVDPATSGASTRVVLGIDAGNLNVSTDDGRTWTDIQWGSSRVATDVPWLSWTNEF